MFLHHLFSRPESLALVGSSLVVLCAGILRRKFTFTDFLQSQDDFGVGAVSINDSTADFVCAYDETSYFEVSNSSHTLNIVTTGGVIKRSFVLDPSLVITAISFDSSSGCVLLGYSSSSSVVGVAVLELNPDLSCGLTFVKIDAQRIDGIICHDNNLLISDSEAHSVSVYSNSGRLMNVVCRKGRCGSSNVRWPGNIRRIPTGIAVVDRHNYLIQIFDETLTFLKQFGGKGEALNSFDQPYDLCVNEVDGKVFVADKNNDRILAYESSDFRSTAIVVKRSFRGGLLSRPVGMVAVNNEVYIADRSNHLIQIWSSDFNFLRTIDPPLPGCRPTAIVSVIVKSVAQIIVLYRGADQRSTSILSSYSLQGELTCSLPLVDFNDPQGMGTIDNKIVLSDTLNRRAVLFGFTDSGFEILNILDLSAATANNMFLCRTPSVIEGYIYFLDYSTGQCVITDDCLKITSIIGLNLNHLGLTAIRKIFYIDSLYFVLGRSKLGSGMIVTSNIFDESLSTFAYSDNHSSTFESPVDLIKFGEDYLVLDKESDQLIKINYSNFASWYSRKIGKIS